MISGGNDNGLALFYKQKLNRHRAKQNTKTQSKQNIQDHYDLSNTFYQQFLDSSMMYSSALYETQSETLEDAQVLKVNRLIDTLDIQEGQSILEIGSGWGLSLLKWQNDMM